MVRFLPFLFLAFWLPVAVLANPLLTSGWPNTDFSKTTVDLGEIRSGGPGKDGIMAVWAPRFVVVSQETRLSPREPVIVVAHDAQRPRAYPIRYFMVHEIVNDVIDGLPIAVTFCPLCNSAMVFDRRVSGTTRTFGVSGNLRHSDMIMYDRETESWWQQAIGQGIVGRHAGDRLRQLPSWMESWEAFAARNPDGLVLDAPNPRYRYGVNPYVNYDSSKRPFLYSGELPPGGIDPMARVVRVGNRAWPLNRLAPGAEVHEAGIRINRVGEQASALDKARIAVSRSVASVRVRDATTGKDVPHDVMFAFAFHALFPDGEWMR